MNILRVKNYLSDENGAVTVDWVVLTATTIVISFAVLTVIANGLGAGSHAIDDELENVAASAGSGDAPDGFTNSGYTDDATGERVYVNNDTGEVSVGGVVSDAGDYSANNGYTCTSVCSPQ